MVIIGANKTMTTVIIENGRTATVIRAIIVPMSTITIRNYKKHVKIMVWNNGVQMKMKIIPMKDIYVKNPG